MVAPGATVEPVAGSEVFASVHAGVYWVVVQVPAQLPPVLAAVATLRSVAPTAVPATVTR